MNVAHGEGLLESIKNPRDVKSNLILSQLRKWKDRLKDLKYLFSRQGEERVRNIIRILRTWDNFYQRVNNTPEVRKAVLKDTQKTRDNINATFRREFQERGIGEETNSILAGTILQEQGREVSVFVLKKPSEKGQGNRFLAVEVERDPSSNLPPTIASLVEIDEGAARKFTKVFWYPERMFFHPDDDYPRAATLIFNTHHSTIAKVPSGSVSVFVGKDVRERAALLFSAYENSEGKDDDAINVLKDYLP